MDEIREAVANIWIALFGPTRITHDWVLKFGDQAMMINCRAQQPDGSMKWIGEPVRKQRNPD